MKKIIALFFTASLIIASGCHSGGGDPKTVLISFFDALMKKDIATAKKLSTKDSETMMSLVEMGMQHATDTSDMSKFDKERMQFGDAVINGDVATVPVKDKNTGESTDFTLRKEDGSWKVAFDKSTLMGMAQKKMKEHGMDMNNMKMDSETINKAQKAMDSASQMLNQMKDSLK